MAPTLWARTGGILWSVAMLNHWRDGEEIEGLSGPGGIAIGVVAVVVIVAFLIYVRRSLARLEEKAEQVFPGALEGFPGGRSL